MFLREDEVQRGDQQLILGGRTEGKGTDKLEERSAMAD